VFMGAESGRSVESRTGTARGEPTEALSKPPADAEALPGGRPVFSSW